MKFEMTEPLSQQQLDDFKERDAAWFTGTSSAWKLGDPLIKVGFGVLGRKLLLQRRADEGAGPIWVYKRVEHVDFVPPRVQSPAHTLHARHQALA